MKRFWAEGGVTGAMGVESEVSSQTLRLVFWELTPACNLRCIHCRASRQASRQPDELREEEIRSIIDDLAGFARPIVVLTGGEPLYRPDVLDIACYARDKGLPVALASNGTLIDPPTAAMIRKAGIRRVSVSIDGGCANTHDSFRGIAGSFDRALQGARNLKETGVEVQFNTTIARHNASELERVLELTLLEQAKALHLFMLVPVGCGIQIADNEMLSPVEYERILVWLWRKHNELQPQLELRATCAPHYYRIMRQLGHGASGQGGQGATGTPGHTAAGVTGGKPSSRSGASPQPWNTLAGGAPGPAHHHMASVTKGCLAGTGVCFISHLGIVQPCGYLPLEAGDLRRQSLSDIWHRSKLFSTLREPSLGGKCGLCEYAFVCEGCRARAYAATGDYLAEEPYCAYVPGALRKGRREPLDEDGGPGSQAG